MSSFWKNKKIILLLVNLCILFIFEFLVRASAYYGFVPFKHYSTNQQHILADIDPDFGVWRYSNISSRQQGACFDVNYSSNSYGARDKERIVERQKKDFRFVVLGDSFVEGFGVESESRLTEIAERETGVEMLNFGISGDFSSTQQFLLYQKLASTFSPTHIALFLLPDNDFTDNDPVLFDHNRYRPYLRKNGDNIFERFYTVSFDQRRVLKPMSTSRRIRRKLYNNIYLLNAFRQLGDVFESSHLKKIVKDTSVPNLKSRYVNYTELDMQRLLWGYQNIIEEKGSIPFYIFVIPRANDFKSVSYKQGEGKPRLIKELDSFAAQYPTVQVVDLLPIFQNSLAEKNLKVSDAFLPCDGHWSSLGHSIAAGELVRIVEDLG
jgi:hypothetical protein